MTGAMGTSSGGASAAFFDVDGTLIHTTIVHYFIYFKFRSMPRWKSRIWYPWFLAKCGGYLALDKFNRPLLNRIVYGNYAGMRVDEIKASAADCVRAVSDARWLVGAREKIQEHRNAGQSIVLVTGSLDFLMAALETHTGGADVLAATLEERDGRFTGKLVGMPVVAEEKRRVMMQYAAEHGLDMKRCHAYGDSCSDLQMLEAVGFPHAVNPDRKLRAIAGKRGWPIHDWPVENWTKRSFGQQAENCTPQPHPLPEREKRR